MSVCTRRTRGATAALALAAALLVPHPVASAGSGEGLIGINVVLEGDVTEAALADLGTIGRVLRVLDEIDAVVLQARASDLHRVRSRTYVAAANRDAERRAAPVDTVPQPDLSDGRSTWDLDAVEVTDLGHGRTVPYDGAGVYVAVLDTGLLDTWRRYFPEERVATRFATAFSGGGGGRITEVPHQWEHDTDSHGTHVTSTVLGYDLRGAPVNGVAPRSTVIPVKVLNQAGWGWSSVIAAGLVHVTELKRSGALGEAPLVVNMSLGGGVLDAVEQAALDHAVAHGVIVVAAAGNGGTAGMTYPAAYAPVISVAASGWTGEWLPGSDGNRRNWWSADDVADPTRAEDSYIADFSSRAKAGQDLDLAAPGSWVLGPYQLQSGKTSYYFLGGTSMAAPHVAGAAALLAQADPALTGPQVESVLEATAIALPSGCRLVAPPAGGPSEPVCWGDDASGAGLLDAAAALRAAGSAP